MRPPDRLVVASTKSEIGLYLYIGVTHINKKPEWRPDCISECGSLLKAGVRYSERRRRERMSFHDGVFSSSEITTGTAEQSQPASPVAYRDPNDVRTIYQLLSVLLITLALFVLSAVGNAWQYWRRPDRIVVDRSSRRVLMINDRQFGETDDESSCYTSSDRRVRRSEWSATESE